jgi:fermentation-respiration switch protein FrsA (DUF1100 family)
VRAREIAYRSGSGSGSGSGDGSEPGGGLAMSAEIVLPDEGARWLVVLCHGIPSGRPPDPSDLGYGGFARDLAARGLGAVWSDFRGVRTAPGEFSIDGWARDLGALLDALRAHDETRALRLAVCGSSAGGATAIRVAAGRDDIDALATFASPAAWEFGDDLARDARGLIAYFRNIGIVRDPAFPPDPDAWLAEFARGPEDDVARVGPTPLLIVHGDADDVVPYPHAERLFARAGNPKELVRIPAGAHQLRKDARAVDALCDWLAHVPSRMPPAN